MLIRCKRTCFAVDLLYAGSVYELPEREAQNLIQMGKAEAVDMVKTAPDNTPETTPEEHPAAFDTASAPGFIKKVLKKKAMR